MLLAASLVALARAAEPVAAPAGAASVARVTFGETAVGGFPRHPEQPACDLYFQWEHPTRGWVRYLPLAGQSPVDDARFGDNELLPAHFVSPYPLPRCGDDPQDPPQVPWRLVDGDGAVVTTFDGPWAVDARPLAVLLGEVERYEAGRDGPPACPPDVGHDCWTALELWLTVVQWQRANCETLDPTLGDALDAVITAGHAEALHRGSDATGAGAPFSTAHP